MLKRICLLVLALCLIGGCLMISVTADDYDYEQGKVIVKSLPAVWLIHFKPTDITGATAIKFDFFIDNADNFRLSALEFGSHYRNDWQELQYTGIAKWPSLQDGWNSVTMPLSLGDPVASVNPSDGTSGTFDPATFQRIRIFNTTGTDPQITIGFRNIVAVKDDGTEIPVGSPSSGTPSEPPVELDPILDITVQPGGTESSLRFNWIATSQPEDPFVEIALFNEEFETHKTVIPGTYSTANSIGVSGSDILFRYSCKATVEGLKPDTYYRYRVGDKNHVSDFYSIQTQSASYTQAYILSDIHVIDHPSWTDKLPVSIENWKITLGQLLDRGEASMILSLGDQMQDTTRMDYLDGFFGIPDLTDIIIAPINGNHDVSPASKNLPKYTNVPNEVFPGSMGISDYYFKSGKTLFVMLSLTDINFDEVDHSETFRKAVAAYPDYDWMVVGFHEAIYGNWLTKYSAAAGDPLDYCNEFYEKYIEVLDQYKPDLVLTGHSHIYGRSHFMRDGEIQTVEQDETGAFISPSGTVYINMGTSSRMWQFGNTSQSPNWPFSYLAFTCSDNGKAVYTYGLLDIDGDRLTLDVYDNLEPDKLIDTITIRKEIKSPEPATETETDAPEPLETNPAGPTGESSTEPVSSPETSDTAPKKGCSGILTGGLWLLGTVAAGGALLLKRKKA